MQIIRHALKLTVGHLSEGIELTNRANEFKLFIQFGIWKTVFKSKKYWEVMRLNLRDQLIDKTAKMQLVWGFVDAVKVRR